MSELLPYQYALIGLVFIWSGFVRSGLGFGGAVLSLPFLLLIDNQPLVFLPLIAVHLLFFSGLTLLAQYSRQARHKSSPETVNWPYLKHALLIMIIPKLIGVFGLITLPNQVMSSVIFVIVTVYAISYILNKPFGSNNRKLDALFLILGGYISGTSLIAAPLIIGVFAANVSREQLRNTLFALWFILVTIKMLAFVYAGVDLQLIQHLWLLPCAGLGHFIGLRFHRYMLSADQSVFYRVLGAVLLIISFIGLWKAIS